MALIPDVHHHSGGRAVNNINNDGQLRMLLIKFIKFFVLFSNILREGIFRFVNFEVFLYFCKSFYTFNVYGTY